MYRADPGKPSTAHTHIENKLFLPPMAPFAYGTWDRELLLFKMTRW